MKDPIYIPSVHDNEREYKIVYVPLKSPVYDRLSILLKSIKNHDKTHAGRDKEIGWYNFLHLNRGWRLCTHHRIFESHQLTFCRKHEDCDSDESLI